MKSPLRMLAASALLLFPAAAAEADGDPHLGEIQTFAGDYCPKGFAPLDGQLLPIASNQALYFLLGTRYGGDGTTTFALPKGRAAPTLVQGAPLTQCIALQGIFPVKN